MDAAYVFSSLAAAALALAHLFSAKLRFLDGTPRSIWLSIGGGVSVAYVFVHLLPELAESQEVIAEAIGEGLAVLENHVYVVALLGLAAFYGLERAAATSRKREGGAGREVAAGAGVFWLHMASFSVYNVLIGYLLLHRVENSVRNLVLFSLAMLLHFIVNDYGLREHHKDTYARIGRWILAAAVLAGWVLGVAVELPEPLIAVLIAFIAGGVVLNVLKEELPEERGSRFWAFALGAVAYTVLLLALVPVSQAPESETRPEARLRHPGASVGAPGFVVTGLAPRPISSLPTHFRVPPAAQSPAPPQREPGIPAGKGV